MRTPAPFENLRANIIVLTLAVAFPLLAAQPCFAQSPPPLAVEKEAPPLVMGLSTGTEFPLLMSAEVRALIVQKFGVRIGYGKTPTAYARFIGNTIDRYANTSGYGDVLEGGFASNHSISIGADYHFNGQFGWSAGLGAFFTSADGTAGISQVETITGTTYPVLRALLNATGKSLIFTTALTYTVLEAHGGYTWNLGKGFGLTTSLGLARVLDPKITLSSTATNFDNSNAGKSLYSQTQTSLTDTISKYGYSPLLGVRLSYWF